MQFLTEPKLDKPAPSWSRDLPEPNAPPTVDPYPPALTNPPNHVDEFYMELARSTLRTRGIGIWIGAFIIMLTAAPLLVIVDTSISSRHFEIVDIFIPTSAVVIFIWIGTYMWRMETAAPRDEPIRFNRLRRKVYIYRFHHNGRYLFARKSWFTRAEVYDWDNLRAESCSIYGPVGSGGLIETVTIAIVKPGTNKVLDRFHFAHGGLEGEMYWALAQLYMQQGPEALPKFDRAPRDWNNEDVTLNLARYLAPKVKWPEAMDLESRTAPGMTLHASTSNQPKDLT